MPSATEPHASAEPTVKTRTVRDKKSLVEAAEDMDAPGDVLFAPPPSSQGSEQPGPPERADSAAEEQAERDVSVDDDPVGTSGRAAEEAAPTAGSSDQEPSAEAAWEHSTSAPEGTAPGANEPAGDRACDVLQAPAAPGAGSDVDQVPPTVSRTAEAAAAAAQPVALSGQQPGNAAAEASVAEQQGNAAAERDGTEQPGSAAAASGVTEQPRNAAACDDTAAAAGNAAACDDTAAAAGDAAACNDLSLIHI